MATKACHTCGRVISSRANTRNGGTPATAKGGSRKAAPAAAQATSQPQQQESKYCSHTCKQDKPKAFDRAIETAFLSQSHQRRSEAVVRRSGVLCTEIEEEVFGESRDGAKKRRERAISSEEPADAGEETPAERGMREAKQRERVRRAGRRLVAFGVTSTDDASADSLDLASAFSGRSFDCVQDGKPVEASFAKGDWGVRVKD